MQAGIPEPAPIDGGGVEMIKTSLGKVVPTKVRSEVVRVVAQREASHLSFNYYNYHKLVQHYSDDEDVVRGRLGDSESTS